jgi:hypothetical protein
MARAASGKDSDIDVRTEMRVALFWRALIGDFEYIRYSPDDMLRWYIALELRGPEEIRELVSERYSSRPMPVIHGVVSKAPHPPTQLVRDWLAYHEQQVRVGAYWWAPIGFCVLCGLVFPFFYGCQNLQPVNPLVMNPPATGPQAPNSAQNTPTYGAASSMVPPVTQPVVTMTGPTSSGIAGGASGSVPAAGVTGPVNGGASSSTGPP